MANVREAIPGHDLVDRTNEHGGHCECGVWPPDGVIAWMAVDAWHDEHLEAQPEPPLDPETHDHRFEWCGEDGVRWRCECGETVDNAWIERYGDDELSICEPMYLGAWYFLHISRLSDGVVRFEAGGEYAWHLSPEDAAEVVRFLQAGPERP